MILHEAEAIASNIVRQLEPHCDRIIIAGSIRRRRAQVGDIEIVCLPKKVEIIAGQASLFGDAPKVKVVVPEFIRIINQYEAVKGEPTGRYTQRIIHPPGMKIDFFMPQEHDYFRILAIRTGSAEFARKIIAGSWVRDGWVGTSEGLRREHECTWKNEKWVCNTKNPKTPPAWQSEQHFFAWLNLPYLEPVEREVIKTTAK